MTSGYGCNAENKFQSFQVLAQRGQSPFGMGTVPLVPAVQNG